MSEHGTEPKQPSPGSEPAATLLPIDDEGGFLVFGELPESLDIHVEPVPYLREEQVRGLADKLADAAGITNLLAQGWNAYNGYAGLVRLAPETLAAMRAGAAPLTQGGWALGTLAKGGKFVAQVRWAPLGAAGVGVALAELGPALALLAIQWQLMKIDAAVRRNIELTQTVLDELREESWYELDAHARVVLASVQSAQTIGEVTDLAWDYLQAQSTLPTLLKHRQRNLDALTRKLADLGTAGSSSEWYRQNFADVLRHSQAVMTAQQAISLHQLMRMAHARRTGDARDELLAQHVLKETRTEHEQIAARIDASLRGLHRALCLWHEVEPGAKLSVYGVKGVPLVELRDAVAYLHLRATTGPFRQLRPIPPARTLTSHRSVGVPSGDQPAIEQRLRWILNDEESALLLTKGDYQFGDDEPRNLLVVTEFRALLVDSAALKKGRAETNELPVQANLVRTLRDGYERVELDHEGRQGILKTKAATSVVYDALMALRSRQNHSSDEDLVVAPRTGPAMGSREPRV